MTGVSAGAVSSRRAGWSELAKWGLLAGLMMWAIVPIVVIAIHAAVTDQRLTGADGLIGADQLQYLSWARDAGAHGLASDLFEISPSGHVYLEPMFAITGLLWRAGLSLTAAYWLWKPIAALILFLGAAAWVERLLANAADRLAGLALALFMLTPIASLTVWVAIGSVSFRAGIAAVGSEMQPAAMLWGYLPSALAIGLMAVALLSCERVLSRPSLAEGRRPMLLACVCGLLASWLHPWQGATLTLVLIGLAAWEGRRGPRLLALPIIAAILPLAYYELLPHIDSAWKLAAHNEMVSRPPFLALLAGVGPLLILAAIGLRKHLAETAERALVLWVPAGLITYFAVNSYSSHALDGLSLPLAVLAVRGWHRLKLPVLAGLATIALLTLPGLVYEARELHRVSSSSVQEYYLNRSETRALSWVARSAPPGGVLAPVLLAIAIPSETGRAVWVGHEFWSRDYGGRLELADGLFDGLLPPGEARALVRVSGARLLVSSCAENSNLMPALGALIASLHRFGCSTVYVVSR